jgi:hypothetical protein
MRSGGAFGYMRDPHLQLAQFLLAEKDFLKRKRWRLSRRADPEKQDVLLRWLAGHEPRERGHDEDRHRADGRAAPAFGSTVVRDRSPGSRSRTIRFQCR